MVPLMMPKCQPGGTAPAGAACKGLQTARWGRPCLHLPCQGEKSILFLFFSFLLLVQNALGHTCFYVIGGGFAQAPEARAKPNMALHSQGWRWWHWKAVGVRHGRASTGAFEKADLLRHCNLHYERSGTRAFNRLKTHPRYAGGRMTHWGLFTEVCNWTNTYKYISQNNHRMV